jgi:hypothetical protein
MAILHRNPMPLNSALFVTNPRRKKMLSRFSLRKNGPKTVSIFDAMGMNSKKTEQPTTEQPTTEKAPND